MYKNLRHFIEALEKADELVRISVPVNPVLEIAEITDRVSKSPGGGKALLFENTGTAFPVLTNMFGSDRRMALALGVERLDDIAARLDDIFKKALSPKNGLADKLRMLPLLGEMSRWLPVTSAGRGECQQVVSQGDGANLNLMPILQCCPCDGGRFVTLPLVNTADPVSDVRNVGMYRMQVTGERTTGMHWHLHKTGERHFRGYQTRGERMPVSVCLGGDPVYTYAATAPMPDNMDEYLLAGFLRRKPVKLVKCITNDIYVPADCDFVVEGYVDPAQEKFLEGPFGDHTGFYSLEDMYPEFHVTAITHRKDAVYPATIVGIPPQEDAYIAKATEKIFLVPIRLALQPEIKDMYMPPAGTAHNLAMVSIDKSYRGQALKTASALWGAGQMMFNKILLVLPSGVNLRDTFAIARRIRNADIGRDFLFSRGVLDILDHAAATPGTGGKVAADLTEERDDKIPVLPAKIETDGKTVSADRSMAAEWGIIILRCAMGSDPDIGQFLASNKITGINYIVLADTATETLSPEELLWYAAANTDPGRDITIADGVMIVDARTKFPRREGYPPRVPNVVVSAPGTVALVDKRWAEYGLGDACPSPSEHFRPLSIGDKADVR